MMGAFFYGPHRHVSQLDKPSKRYRGVHADVFVIADEDDNGILWLFDHCPLNSIFFFLSFSSLLLFLPLFSSIFPPFLSLSLSSLPSHPFCSFCQSTPSLLSPFSPPSFLHFILPLSPPFLSLLLSSLPSYPSSSASFVHLHLPFIPPSLQLHCPLSLCLPFAPPPSTYPSFSPPYPHPENPNASGSDDEARQEMVNISMYSGGPGITHTFPATEIYESREYQRSVIEDSAMGQWTFSSVASHLEVVQWILLHFLFLPIGDGGGGGGGGGMLICCTQIAQYHFTIISGRLSSSWSMGILNPF